MTIRAFIFYTSLCATSVLSDLVSMLMISTTTETREQARTEIIIRCKMPALPSNEDRSRHCAP